MNEAWNIYISYVTAVKRDNMMRCAFNIYPHLKTKGFGL